MKRFKLQSGSNVGSSSTNSKTGYSRHERTRKVSGTVSGLVSETSLAGENTVGKGTANSRYVSTKPGTVQVIDSGRSLRTNSATADKGTPDLIGTTYVSSKPKRKRY